jgi:ABC-2 type transport system permease protein
MIASLPRAVLQCLFFTLLGRALGGGQGEEYAFIGALAAVQTLSCAVAICDVPMLDKWSGTFYRIRIGRLSPTLVFFARALPHVLLGFTSTVACLLIVAPLIGRFELVPRLLPALPMYLLMAFTIAVAGLACAALAVGPRADVLVGNVLAYLMLLTGGVFVPQGRLPIVDALGAVLPVRHGIEGVRALLSGRPWSGAMLTEELIGCVWGSAAWTLVSLQVRRAYRDGTDDFE